MTSWAHIRAMWSAYRGEWRGEVKHWLATRELPGRPPSIEPHVVAKPAGMEALLGKRGAP